MRKEVTSFRLPPALMERVREAAARCDVTASQFTRLALEHFLNYLERKERRK